MVVRLRDVLVNFLTIGVGLSVFRHRFVALMGVGEALVGEGVLCHRFRHLSLFKGPCESMIVHDPILVRVRQMRTPHVVDQYVLGASCGVLAHRRADFHFFHRERVVGEDVHVVRRRVLLTSARFVDRIVKGETLNFRRVAVLRVVELFVDFAVRVGGAVLCLRHLSKRARAPLRMILATICQATSCLARIL